jgi:hypothetical protein
LVEVVSMCKIEGICLDCAESENCPMLIAHRGFSGTLKSVTCIAFKPMTVISSIKYSFDTVSSAEPVGAASEFRD